MCSVLVTNKGQIEDHVKHIELTLTLHYYEGSKIGDMKGLETRLAGGSTNYANEQMKLQTQMSESTVIL